MPDGSIHTTLADAIQPDQHLLSTEAIDLTAYRPVELAKRAMFLDRIQEDEKKTLSFDESNRLFNLECEAMDQVVASTPTTLADATAMLLTIGDSVRGAMNNKEERSTLVDPWLALGRVVKFLADEAGVQIGDIGGLNHTHSVNGLDDHLAADWWIDRFLEVGGALHLSAKGAVSICLLASGNAEDEGKLAQLVSEHATLDQSALAKIVSNMVFTQHGRSPHNPNVAKGRRWLIERGESYLTEFTVTPLGQAGRELIAHRESAA